MDEVPDAVAAGVVDVDLELMLAITTVDSHPQAVIDLLAPATRQLFEGDMVVTIEDLFKQSRGVDDGGRYLQEMLISSRNLWHYFGRLESSARHVLCVVTAADVDVNAMLAKARRIRATGTV